MSQNHHSTIHTEPSTNPPSIVVYKERKSAPGGLVSALIAPGGLVDANPSHSNHRSELSLSLSHSLSAMALSQTILIRNPRLPFQSSSPTPLSPFPTAQSLPQPRSRPLTIRNSVAVSPSPAAVVSPAVVKSVMARQIIDSRGNPTVEVDLVTDTLEGLSSCTNPKWLSVVENKLESLKGIERLPNLMVLNAGKN